jgi:hypothetical protein
MSTEQIRSEIERNLQSANLLPFVDMNDSQFLDIPETFVEIVLNDGGKVDEVRQALNSLQSPVDLRIHPVWQIESIGEPELVISQAAGISIARLIAVRLRSGSLTTVVQVSVSWEAEEELKKIRGSDPDLKNLTREFVEDRLTRRGQSYWDPRRYSRLEIGADRALSLYRALQKTA